MLFTFPSRYWFTIGLWRVFSLGGWARRIHTGFHVPRATQEHATLQLASDTGLSPSAARLSSRFSSLASCDIAVLQPRSHLDGGGLGCSPFARHYWGNHFCFLFLPVLRCFSSRRSPPAKRDDRSSTCRVAPFRHPGIKGRLHLPPAFRSLPRLSSPSRA